MALYYCKRCGRLIQNSWNDDNFCCDCCQAITNPVPIEFLDGKINVFFKDKNTERQFIDEYIKASPEFDQYLFDHKDEILAKQSAEFNAKMEHGKAILEEQSRQPECPTCHNKNVQRISGFERGVSIIGLGIFSKKINKSYKCKNCGYTW